VDGGGRIARRGRLRRRSKQPEIVSRFGGRRAASNEQRIVGRQHTQAICETSGMDDLDMPEGEKLLPSGCPRIIELLEEARAKFAAWGPPAGRKGPLPLAMRRLREIVARDTYGTTEDDLRSAAGAVAIAIDYIAIASRLPPTMQPYAARELARMFDGTLDLREYHGAHDLRAQFVFSALMLNNGYPIHVVHSPTNAAPDFVVTFINKDYGLEVKRPANETQMIKRLDKAARQLAALGRPGFVVLDLSRIHAQYQATVSPLPNGQSLSSLMRLNFIGHASMVATYCEAQANNSVKRSKFSYVLGVICLVKIPYWLDADRSAPAIIGTHAEGPVLWSSTERGLFGEALAFVRLVGELFGGTRYGGLGFGLPGP
jgi:hypothetical protein